jgi:hypothetical protein
MQEKINTDQYQYSSREVPFSFVAIGILFLGIFFTALSLLWV